MVGTKQEAILFCGDCRPHGRAAAEGRWTARYSGSPNDFGAGAGEDTRVSHAIYFVSREDYDRMLPLTVRPVPTALVRVGVVIELFER